jgi:hypothetical protein
MSLKEGDRISNRLLGKDYRLKWMGDKIVVLESEDGSNQILTTKDGLKLFYEKVEPGLRSDVPGAVQTSGKRIES